MRGGYHARFGVGPQRTGVVNTADASFPPWGTPTRPRRRANPVVLTVPERQPERRHVVGSEAAAPPADARRDTHRSDLHADATAQLVSAGDLRVTGAQRKEGDGAVLRRDTCVRARP